MRTILLTAALATLATTPIPAWAHVVAGLAQLTADQEVPTQTTPPPATAGGTVEYEVTTDVTIEYRLTVQDLTGPAIGAHIHEGAAGVPGDIVFPLVQVDDTTFEGETAMITDEQLTTLMRGGLYFNVHTAANPAGEVRAQIVGFEINRGTCSCRSLSRKDFRRCVSGELKTIAKADRKDPEVKALKKAYKKSACGLSEQPRKKPHACCLPISETERNIVTGEMCAPVKSERQCGKLGGTFLTDTTCLPTSPCIPPASPSGAFLD
jgi:hypothetical protein